MDQKILSALLLGVGFFVPFSNALTNIFWIPALFYVVALGSVRARWRELNLPKSILGSYLLLLFFSLLSGLHAQSFSGLRHEPLVGLFLVLALGVNSQAKREKILWAFAFGTGLICLLGILQVTAGAGTPWWAKEPRWTQGAPEWLLMFLNSYEGRAVGTRGHPNTYGQFLAASLPLLLIWASSLGKKSRMAWGILSLGIFATLLSMSRIAWLAMLVLLPAGAMLLRRKDLLFGFLLIAGCAGLGALTLTRLPADGDARTHIWKERFSGTGAVERFAKWRVTVELIRRNPWLGVGPGKIREAYLATLRERFPQNIVEKSALMGDPHNLYLRMACERGLPALILFLAFALNLFWFLFIRSGGSVQWWLDHHFKFKSRGDPIALGCALGIAAMFLCGFTESVFWDDEMVQGFWFLTGLALIKT